VTGGRRGVRLVKLALKVVMVNDGDFVEVILLYFTTLYSFHVTYSNNGGRYLPTKPIKAFETGPTAPNFGG
jgi:hypothetical protein